MLCPRCQRESREGTVFCPGCGAPLSLQTERQAALDATLDLDRRAPRLPEAVDADAPTLVRPPPAAPATRAAAVPSAPASPPERQTAPKPPARPAAPPRPARPTASAEPPRERPAALEPRAAPRVAEPLPTPLPGPVPRARELGPASRASEPLPTPLPGPVPRARELAPASRASEPLPTPLPGPVPRARKPGPAPRTLEPPPTPLPGPVPRARELGPTSRASEPLPAPPPGPVPRALEPGLPPLGDLSHWDMRLSQLPQERSPALDGPAARVPPPALPASDLRPEPKPAPRPARRASPNAAGAPGDLPTVEIDVGPLEIQLHRAPDWRRIGAWILDGIPFAALFGLVLRYALDRLPHPPLDVLGYLDLAIAEARDITGPVFASVVVLYAVYQALSHGLSGATLGKRLLGLRVVCKTGHRPGMGRAAVRSALALVSVALVGLGILLALFTRSGRGLHDFLARTWVVKAP